MTQLNEPGRRIVGTKQVIKALAAGEVETLYIAQDADIRIRSQVLEAAGSVPTVMLPTMAELGALCGIDVGAACAALRKQ